MARLFLVGLIGLTLFAQLAQAKSQGTSGAPILAQVNETEITSHDLEVSVSSLSEGQRSSLLKDSESRRQLLLDIIDKEILFQEAKKLKLDKVPGFQEQAELLSKQLLIARLIEKKFSSQLNQAAVKKYYESHKSKFSTDQAHVQQILVSDEIEAKKILAMLKEPDADFQSLAEKLSKDPSAKNNRGDLGFIGRDRFVPEFTEAAFSASPGETVGPIKTIYGYHLIKVLEKRAGKPLEFDEVELQATNALRLEMMRNYIDSLKSQAKIKVNNGAVEKN